MATSNLPFKERGRLFRNAAAASAVADRPVHKGIRVRITGKSRCSDEELEWMRPPDTPLPCWASARALSARASPRFSMRVSIQPPS
jgi:hypothetical protein